MKFFLAAFICFSSLAYSQNSISGWIKDSDTQEPVPYATVYVDGTTNGTTSNLEGFFELTNVSSPYLLVVSHVSYNIEAIEITKSYPSGVSVSLEQKGNVLNELLVEDEDHRQRNVDYFKATFLGYDTWGKHAIILNDSVLSFSKKTTRVPSLYASADQYGDSALSKTVEREIEFNTYASSQIIVDMPKLGYTLHVDLVDFCVEKGTSWVTKTRYLGYYYYLPYEFKNNRTTKKIDRNREEVYYNSSQHFCRALFSRSLSKNGYVVYEKDEKDDQKDYREFDIDSCLTSIDGEQVGITGLENQDFIIGYFQNNNGTPRDLETQRKTAYMKKSAIYFRSDTCVVTQNGIIPNNNILFSGEISMKGTGASLPADFVLKED